jgi:hypothetical protein
MRKYTIEDLQMIESLLISSRLDKGECNLISSFVQDVVVGISCDSDGGCPYSNIHGGCASEMSITCNKLSIRTNFHVTGWPCRLEKCPYHVFTKIDSNSRYTGENGIYCPLDIS